MTKNKRMKIQHFKKIFIIIFFSINLVCQGQYKRSLPPSPNAASLGVFGQIDVNGFNGLPNIEIPIYEINTKGFKFPIKIMYHASGVKPDIRAGWLGQNWSLNCNM